MCICVSEAVAANKFLRQSWLNLPLSEALFSHYCLPRTTPNPLSTSCLSFTACFKSHLLQEKLSEITPVRMNHFPSHGIFFLTAPKAFTSCVNYLYLSLYSLLSCELQKGMSRIFLCFLQPCKYSAFHTTYALQMLTEWHTSVPGKTEFEKGQWNGGLSWANLYVSSYYLLMSEENHEGGYWSAVECRVWGMG